MVTKKHGVTVEAAIEARPCPSVIARLATVRVNLEPFRWLLAHQFIESRSFQPIEIALAGSGLSQQMFGDLQR
jgi:hypothetical protein